MAEETPSEREERLQRQEERLKSQHERLSNPPPARESGGGGGGALSGIGTFFAEHKVAVIVTGGILLVAVVIYYLSQQGAQGSAATPSNEQGSLGNAGYQDQGVAYALTQLGQQLNNLNTAFSNVAQGGTTTTPPATTPPAGTTDTGTNPPPTQGGTGQTASAPFNLDLSQFGNMTFFKGAQGRFWAATDTPGNMSKTNLSQFFPEGTTFSQQGRNGPLWYTVPGFSPQQFPFQVTSNPNTLNFTPAWYKATGSTPPKTGGGTVPTFAQTRIAVKNKQVHSPGSNLAFTMQTPPHTDLYHNGFVRESMTGSQHFGVIRPLGKFVYAPRVAHFKPIVMPATISMLRPIQGIEGGRYA